MRLVAVLLLTPLLLLGGCDGVLELHGDDDDIEIEADVDPVFPDGGVFDLGPVSDDGGTEDGALVEDGGLATDATGAADLDPPPPDLPPSVAQHPTVLLPKADAHVQSGSKATSSLGTAKALWIDKNVVDNEVAQAYMRFSVGKVGHIARALLRLYITNGSKNSFDVVTISDTAWSETITWNNKPAVDGAVISTFVETTAGTWVEIDVTSHVSPGTVFSIAFVPRSGDGVGIASREAATHRPKLVLEIGADIPANAVQPEADTYVRSGTYADKSYGKQLYFDVDGQASGTEKQAFIRFQVGAASTLKRAMLRLYLLDGSKNSATVVSIKDHTWNDSITWNTKPAVTGTNLGTISATSRGWVELDVTPAVAPNSKLSLALLPSSSDGIRVASMEAAFYRPLLLLVSGKATCGDGRCDTGETCKSCPADCGACPSGCMAGELFPIFGDIHVHTSDSDGQGTPAQAFKMAKSAKLDFLIVTDHISQLDSKELSGCLAAADAANVTGTFVASCGWEGRIGNKPNVLGHANVFFSKSLSSVPNTADYATWYANLGACSGCIGQINHPTSSKWPWVSYSYNSKAAENLALHEFNSSGTFAEKLVKYTTGLDNGWRLAATWNSDTHEANWGSAAVRSGFWVTALSRTALATAMRERRSFGSRDSNATLRVRAGRCWPGSDLSGASIETIEVMAIDPNDNFDRVVLIGAGNKALRTFPCNDQKICGGTTQIQVTAKTYVLAYAVQKDGDRVVTSPIWLSP